MRKRAEWRAAPPPGAALPADDELHALLDRYEARIDRYDGHFGDDAPRQLKADIECLPGTGTQAATVQTATRRSN